MFPFLPFLLLDSRYVPEFHRFQAGLVRLANSFRHIVALGNRKHRSNSMSCLTRPVRTERVVHMCLVMSLARVDVCRYKATYHQVTKCGLYMCYPSCVLSFIRRGKHVVELFPVCQVRAILHDQLKARNTMQSVGQVWQLTYMSAPSVRGVHKRL